MKIYPGENASGHVSGNRLNDRSFKRGEARVRSADKQPAVENPVPEIRKQILVVQRSLGRTQSVLGGFEGFERLLGSKAASEEAARYIGGVVYRGETVLEPFSAELNRILQREDRSALQGLITNAREEIQGFAVQLIRLQTAEQNSRSLNLFSGAGIMDKIFPLTDFLSTEIIFPM